MFSGILTLLKALPEILQLIKHFKALNEERKIKKTVKENIAEVNVAFESKDAKKLKAIFMDEEPSNEKD